MRRNAGWTIIILSCLLWAALPVIPFLTLNPDDKAYWAGGLFIAAEITWYAGLFLLGPEAIALIKTLWLRAKHQLRKTKTSPDHSD